jgi:hypothetical protein
MPFNTPNSKPGKYLRRQFLHHLKGVLGSAEALLAVDPSFQEVLDKAKLRDFVELNQKRALERQNEFDKNFSALQFSKTK